MMKQLKGLLSGKSVKQLFITSLVSCFILLGNSFVSALTVEQIGVNMSSPVSNNSTTFTVLPYGSFMGSYLGLGKPVIAFANRSLNSSNTKGQYIYFMRVDGKPYYYYSYAVNSSSSMINFQGFINEYKLCDELTENSTSISNCSDSVYFGAVVNDFLSTVKTTDYYGINWSSNRASLCISSSQYSKSLCFWDLSSSKLTGSINIPTLTAFDNLEGYDSQSPAVPITPSNPGGNGGTTVNFITNKQATYNALYRKGYRSQLCYGGFELDDLFGTGNSSFGDIKVSSGATVFELFDTYGNGFSFVSWYDNNYLDYLYLESFKDEYEYSRFIGKSRGLIGLGIVRKSYFRGNDTDFNAGDLRTFCSLYFSDEVDTEVSPIGQLDSMLGDDNVDGIIGDLGILIPSSGSALDMLFQQVFSGVCSGSVEECLMASGNVSDMVNSSWNTWSLRGLRGGIDGILPTYIVVGFFGILLLYYLRR